MTANLNARLLLDRISIYGAMVEIGCNLLAIGPRTGVDFRALVAPGQEEETAAELIPFLRDSGLVDLSKGQLCLAKHYRSDWTVQANLLCLLHRRTDVNYVFRFVWEALLDRPEWCNTFVNRDEVWPVVNQMPVPGASIPQLNSNRMSSWMRLASWIGLIQPERSNSFILVPTESLVIQLLSYVLVPGKESALSTWVSAVEAQFCKMTTGPGQLHHGFAVVLSRLKEKGAINFITYSDEISFQIGSEHVSHMVLRKERAA
ncbi:MAG TPA: hypothetical protein VD969_23450 [Symbiobacteriaceae bacterium]|nr:hypothetical protein [Symbiobacteriaceae bacterium]